MRASSTREHIIDVAARAFAAHGLDGTSLNDLVRASRVSKGAFYFHFPSKEELALACFRTKQEELIRRVMSEEAPQRAADRVRFLMRRRAQLVREDPSLGCVTRLGSELNVRSRPGSTYAAFQDLGLELIEGVIRDGQQRREFRSELDAKVAAEAVYAGVLGIDVLSLLRSDGRDLEARSEALTELILRGLTHRDRERARLARRR